MAHQKNLNVNILGSKAADIRFSCRGANLNEMKNFIILLKELGYNIKAINIKQRSA
jgi:hypothetical protein